jgi:hypothetical protein
MGSRSRKARGLERPPDTPLDKERAVAKLTRLKGRGVEVNFVPSGVVVEAGTPEELVRETDKELVRRSGDAKN